MPKREKAEAIGQGKAQLGRDVHLLLSPRAAQILDQALGVVENNSVYLKTSEQAKIVRNIRKEIRSFAIKDPK